MVLDATALAVAKPTSPVVIPAWPSARERQELLDQLNLALRRPEEHGGPAEIGRLMDRLAGGEPLRVGGRVWLPDTNARMSTAGLIRTGFTDPELQVVASQYAVDAHVKGWLRLDRTLTAKAHTDLVGSMRDWACEDRTLSDVLNRFGEPSVVHGSPEPERPKSLTYACADRDAPVVTFHLAAGTPAMLLTVRIDENFMGGWEMTPYGEAVFLAAE